MKIDRQHAKYTALVVLILCFTLSGCASFKRNRLPSITELPKLSKEDNRPHVTYSFSSGVEVFGKQEHLENVRKILEEEFLDVLRESGYFASLEIEGDHGIKIRARLVNYGSGIGATISGAISGATLCVIPGWATDGYKATVRVNAADKKEHEYILDDAMTTVFWLPMAVVYPFKTPQTVGAEVRKNIYRNLLIRMQQDGILLTPESAKETSAIILEIDIVPMV